MKTCPTVLVIYFSILGSSNIVGSVTGTAVTSEPAFSDYTSASSSSSSAATTSDSTITSIPLTSNTVTSQSTTKTVQSISSGVTTVSPGRSGKVSSTTTATSPGPWRVVALSLSAVTGVLLLAFTITGIILCKMRSKLGQASKTLYPITTSPDANEYLDIESGTQKKYKKGMKVELTNIISNTEEEFDSPTFPPTPPVKPRRSVRPQVPSSHPPSVKVSGEAPKLPSRSANKFPLSKISKENITGKSATEQVKLQKSGPNSITGETNRAFENDEAKSGNGNGIVNLHDDDDDDMYESYEHGYTGNPATVADDFDDTENLASYEEPVKSSVSHQIQRQGSSTGLPELAGVQRVPSREQVQDSPLQEAEEDDEEFDVEGFGNVGADSGLPDMTGMTHIDDLQYFDDPAEMTAQVNEINEDAEDLKNKEHERQGAPSPTSDSMDDLLTYDDADMELGNIDENQDDDNEPGFYEDFDMGENNVLPDDIHAKRENIVENELELPKVPPRRKSTIDKNRRLVDDTTKITEDTSRSESSTEASGDVPDLSGLPSVPLRRDLLRKQSETDSVDETFTEIVPTLESPPVINMDTFPREVAQLRPGKSIEEKINERPRDSYFLDIMDDNPVELSDNTSNNVLVSDLVDITGLSEMSNGNAHLSEFGDNDTEFE